MNSTFKGILAALIGFGAAFATGMLAVASGMTDADTLQTIATREWIEVIAQSCAAAFTTLGAYLLKSPKEAK